jgi:hypothetical protein
MVAVFFNKVLAIYRLPSYRRIPGTLLFPQSESFLFFFGISANADMKKAEVPFQYPSFDKMVWNL